MSQPLTHSAVSEVSFWTARKDSSLRIVRRLPIYSKIMCARSAGSTIRRPRRGAADPSPVSTKRSVSLFEKWLFIPGKGYYRGPDAMRISMR